MEGVFVLDGAVGAEVKFARITGPFWKLPLSGIVEIDSGELMGLEVDLSGIRVGDPTAEDYQDLLHRISTDHKFWQERVGLVLSKFTASGMKVHLRNVLLTGKVLMPGDKVVPLRWFILEADSDAPRLIKVSPYPEQPRVM